MCAICPTMQLIIFGQMVCLFVSSGVLCGTNSILPWKVADSRHITTDTVLWAFSLSATPPTNVRLKAVKMDTTPHVRAVSDGDRPVIFM